VGSLKIGDRVAYATAPMGAYCEARNIHHKYLVGVPDNISNEQVAAVLFKGMTAHYLTKRTYFVRPSATILVHAAAGGVGMFVTNICKDAGAKVIGTVGSDDKAAIAQANGCDHVINYNNQDFRKHVLEITQNKGVSVVYDSVGAKTFTGSLQSLGDFGLMVSYGNSSGNIPPLDYKLLSEKNLFFTQPSLFKYKQNRMELCLSAAEVFAMLTKGIIGDNINYKYRFNDINKAHSELENRLTAGSNIIVL
jgi:NADPH2:quinone reductase